ncbi:MAG: type II secretion system protein [Phycisphaerales bacterium]|nr:type II secretion system protein [Phycisphaerales bacterium]
MTTTTTSKTLLPRAFTIVELLVVVAIISLLTAILLPAMGKARDGAQTTQSLGNLNAMSKATFAYGADWSDRHFTAMPDDAGQVGGSCPLYVSQVACPSQQLLGFDTSGGLWGYWISGSLCPQAVGGCYNWPVLLALTWAAPGSAIPYPNSFGSYAMPNTKAFNTYINGRFYDKVFFAPKDRLGLEACNFGLQNEGEFTPNPNGQNAPVFPTYTWSPASLIPPAAHASSIRDCGNAGKQQNLGPGGYRAPSCGMTIYPDQKTLMIEQLWLQNREGPELNTNYATPRAWFFNEGYNSSPACLFFDGHSQLCGMNTAVNDDRRVSTQNASNSAICSLGKGLWHRGTPAGAIGWFVPAAAYDPLIILAPTSFHMFTTDGILGRDILKSGN